ncbi:glutamine--fructose-6-phosphate transaminase (isomerizing) [Diplocloster agilis]|uniref:Glutamine--fructose-6-phosphate aminotransferase [isomerizing] n=1 Tax=Diplocloster agilis TaxID=2850323 RepID=A0A949JWP0_9FIRM|nr:MULTISPECIES: glutamine--fructose-6-phosphate transaminase (isomerizing) [Lachnospiraceae]MBU9736553.1 glutamine--fructose-6-phosphate transaminase (isomerizing) [Diplocloster agilis]MBU9743115.1 glutamine--fructose-6-phosphate transaminase (isomerizing) [Diplocloster agilis]MCU6735157.1 glutamine--fructose-6-phosphate transaminase (isomerizing) [Suonthocola fibrivorans]SCJ65947.1 Glucosamine--fructose-6-phosphate aminotransferase [isomerizing] [uncultured Clostridium sp.]
MCGIVGYTGDEQAAPILLDGLEKLEYRGYDSAGIAVFDGEKIHMAKAAGRLKVLSELTHDGKELPGFIGIGHTRWATHGAPSDTNAHPHCNKDQSIVVVHNGIIENYLKLRKKLESKGYEFRSETDTEVLAHLLDYYYTGDPVSTIIKVMHRVEGSYALGILFEKHPGEMYAVRKDSPLIVGKAQNGNLIASDVPAVLKYTREVCFIENEEIVKLTGNEMHFYNVDEEEITKEFQTIAWDVSAAEKGGYEHFMLKEMYEQPKAVSDTLSPRIKGNRIVIEELGMSDEEIRSIRKIYIIACGSAFHSGMTNKYVFEGLARIPVEVDLASEFRYRDPIFEPDTLVIIVSQSGETADSLAALREAKAHGVPVLGIVNVVGSSIAREADHVMYTWAGPEIAVATTKAYSTQLIAQYLLALKFAQVRGTVTDEELEEMIQDLKELPDQIEMLLNNKEKIQHFANRYIAARDVFFIGRGIDYAISMEGSLKLKEISYIHSEAYAAGELKHGTISLIEDGTLVAAVLTQESLYKKMISNIEEVRTRGAFVLAVTNVGNHEVEKTADYVIYIPKTNRYFTNSLAIIPLQLFGYYVAIGKGCDVDKPRNLAKSVTVE